MEDTSLQSGVLDRPPKRSKFLTLFIFSIFVIVVIFVWLHFFGSKTKKTKAPSATPTPTEYQLPTEAPTPEATKAVKPTSTQTPTPTQKPKPTSNPVDESSGLDRSKLTVEIKNGSGVEGAAGKMSDALKGLGYQISSTGNAGNFDYANVTIQVKSDKSEYLLLLKKDLGFSYTVGTASADLSTSVSADAVVIVGK